MEFEPIVVQGLLSVPITAGLVAYTLTRAERSQLHKQLAVLLSLVVVWMTCLIIGGVAASGSELRRLAFDAEMLSTGLMAALFLILMGGLARSPLFEEGRKTTRALLWMCGTLSILYLTDDYHHLFFDDLQGALRNEHPLQWGGSAYWALQLFCAGCSSIGLGFAVVMAWRGRTSDERNRALLVLAATSVPLIAHLIYVNHWLPFDYSLAPGTLGVTAFCFAHAVNHYGFIVVRPVMRQDVIEHMDDGILLADPQGIVLDANAATERTLGCARHELRGQSLAHSLARLDAVSGRQPVAERIVALPLEGGRIREELRTSDGRSIEVTAGAVAAVASQPAGLFVSLRDRSEQRKSERLLQERQKLESVGIMTAGVAHEVNNPLAYVRSNLVHLQELSVALVEELKRRPGEPDASVLEFPEILDESVSGLDRIATIVRGMLQFSRPSSDEPAMMDVNTLVEDALQLASLQGHRRLRVERRLAEGLPQTEGSAQGLVQVLLNLLLNARQALTEQADGLIIAETRLVESAIEIGIEDNGPGIAELDLPQIFDPFFTTRDPGGGTGLGLSIAFEIVRNHGGTLEYSRAESGGARFTVRLAPHSEAIAADCGRFAS